MRKLEEVLEDWEAVIGLEIHAELTTLDTKMFCGCKLEFGAEPNTHTCPVCLGLPGALPVPNKAAIESIVLAGLATNCDIEKHSMFYRKTYMYPDMSKNYQTTQGPVAFCMRGHLDLEVDGAMTAWMVEAINPNLIQTIEGQPVFVHAGPFANIAIGQSSVIADRIGLKLNEYHVTESGFGADLGYEKFWNLKCHYSGLTPDAAVVVATVRALKSHGGAPVPVPGRPLPEEYRTENVGFVEAGCCNLLHHINTVKRSGVSPVVCINAFVTDTKAEIAKVRELCEAAGARVALSTHWEHGGEGALELADAVMDACNDKTEFKPLYSWDMPCKERIELVAREVYGADGVDFSAEASRKLADIQKRDDANELGQCMVKTHQSLPDDPGVKGDPTGWTLRIRDVLTFGGAGFVVPVSGSITLMPGTGSNPSFRRVDVDVDTGRVKGIF